MIRQRLANFLVAAVVLVLVAMVVFARQPNFPAQLRLAFLCGAPLLIVFLSLLLHRGRKLSLGTFLRVVVFAGVGIVVIWALLMGRRSGRDTVILDEHLYRLTTNSEGDSWLSQCDSSGGQCEVVSPRLFVGYPSLSILQDDDKTGVRVVDGAVQVVDYLGNVKFTFTP